MAKVTYSSAKGLVVESGTGFQVNDAPVLEEIEAVTTDSVGGAVAGAGFGITNVTTDGEGSAGQVITVANGSAAGQLKTVILASNADAGTDTVRVDDATDTQVGSSLTVDGNFIHMVWTGSAWAVVGSLYV
jgi:hypothetical protein